MKIKGSVVIITGGAIRVGKAIGLHLASLGANIAFSYFSPDEDWETTTHEIEKQGVGCLAMKTDVRNLDEIDALITKTYERFGRIDGVINSAGVWLKNPVEKITETEWDNALNINLKGPFFMAQKAAPFLRKTGQGVIINITDLSAFQVWPENAHHSAAKTGLVSITKTLAYELAPTIRVNAAAFGTILLPPNASEEKIKWSNENSALKRIGTLEEAVQLIQFFIENNFVTGSVSLLDGGRSLL